MVGYHTSDVTRITGVNRNTLQVWIDCKFITPGVQEAAGSGSKNVFTTEDLHRIVLFKNLTDWGFARKEAAKYINAEGINACLEGVDSEVEDGSTKPYFIGFRRLVSGQETVEAIFLQDEDDVGQLYSHLAEADYGVIVNISKIVREVRAEMATVGD
jgi:DNA-binding transcriptional MerR regulator